MVAAAVLGCSLASYAAFAAGGTAPTRNFQQAPAEPLSTEALMQHVAFMVDPRLAGRLAGSPGEEMTADYVDGVLKQVGLLPHRQYVALPHGTSINVYALVEAERTLSRPGGRGGEGGDPGELVVIGAHMDHLGAHYPGAEDNASGVAVVLELARALAKRRHELHRSVLFVFFGAEESMWESRSTGARFFVHAPPVPVSRMAVMVNVDMIGRPLLDQNQLGPAKRAFGIDGKRSVGLIGTRHRPVLRALVDSACVQSGIEAVASEDLPDWIDREVAARAEGRDDSVAFEAAGVPSIFLGSGESSDYHAPSDTMDRLQPEVMQRRGQALLRVLLALSVAPRSTFATSTSTCAKCEPSSPLPQRPTPHGWKLPIGLGMGLAVHGEGPSGLYLGFEASLVRFESKSLFWLGGYADVLHDYASDRTRTSLGFELGKGSLGLDGGYLLEFSPQDRRQGLVLRPLVSLSYLSLAGRLGCLWGQGAPEIFGELGVLIKIPLFARWSSAPTR
ncbi:MAG TPA: M20/M25/M40 family metallo-hydrolase [Polyangia bacterium]